MNQPRASTSTAASSSNAAQSPNSHQPVASGSLATPSVITYGQATVRARIDRNVPIQEILRQLCNAPQFAISDPPEMFALRDSKNDELVTESNLHRKIDNQTSFKLVASPMVEAIENVEKLQSGDQSSKKQATFSLRTHIKEEAFVDEFIKIHGINALAGVIQTASGNTLAYALSAMQSILDLNLGWSSLDGRLVSRVVAIVGSQQLVNVTRPALHILRKLIAAEVRKDRPVCGYSAVWLYMSADTAFFKAIATRLARESDKLLMSSALALLNAIMRNVTADLFYETIDTLEKYNFRKAVISLIENRTEDVTPAILQFQQNWANIWHRQQSLPVDVSDSRQRALLDFVLSAAGLGIQSNTDSQAGDIPFKQLGFSGRHLAAISADCNESGAGLLGLSTLHTLASVRPEDFSRLVKEQVNRPSNRRCPIAIVSLQVSRILSEQFDFSGSLASASFQPFLLDYYRVHYLVLEFFVRIFGESGATTADIDRVAMLTASEVATVIGRGVVEYMSPVTGQLEPKTYFTIKQEFEEAKYEEVRDRQMKEMEIEDDLLSKLPVRTLRDRLYRESFEFVKAQRIHCMQLGAWFTVLTPSILVSSTNSQRQRLGAGTRYRFCRLAPNRRYVHWLEAAERRPIRPGLEEFSDKLDLSRVTEIISGITGRTSSSLHRSHSGSTSPINSSGSLRSPKILSPTGGAGNTTTHPLGLTLISQDTVVADMVAPDADTLSEWIDGLNLLTDGYIATQTSAEYIQTLTDIGVKARLLEITGERVNVPTSVPVPPPPPASIPFYYAD